MLAPARGAFGGRQRLRPVTVGDSRVALRRRWVNGAADLAGTTPN